MTKLPNISEHITLLEHLGSGGMGNVYKGVIKKDGFEKDVAIKISKSSNVLTDDIKNHFLDEANLISKLKHPNITQVFDTGVTNNRPYIVLELVEGVNLRDLINEAQNKGFHFSNNFCASIINTVHDALMYAHSLGITHRDVSPHNILIDNNGYIKLTDFGISSLNDNKDQGGKFSGKLSYTDPFLLSDSRADSISDLFSLGLCFYELLTLSKLFDGSTENEILESIKTYKTSFSDRITDHEVSTFLERWLSKSRNTRLYENKVIREFLRSYTIDRVEIKNELENLRNLPLTTEQTFVGTNHHSRNQPKKQTFVLSSIIFVIIFSVLMGLINNKDSKPILIISDASNKATYVYENDLNKNTFRPDSTFNHAACSWLCMQIGTWFESIFTETDKNLSEAGSSPSYLANSWTDNPNINVIKNSCRGVAMCDSMFLVANTFSNWGTDNQFILTKSNQYISDKFLTSLSKSKRDSFNNALEKINNPSKLQLEAYNTIEQIIDSTKERMLDNSHTVDSAFNIITFKENMPKSDEECLITGDVFILNSILENFSKKMDTFFDSKILITESTTTDIYQGKVDNVIKLRPNDQHFCLYSYKHKKNIFVYKNY